MLSTTRTGARGRRGGPPRGAVALDLKSRWSLFQVDPGDLCGVRERSQPVRAHVLGAPSGRVTVNGRTSTLGRLAGAKSQRRRRIYIGQNDQASRSPRVIAHIFSLGSSEIASAGRWLLGDLDSLRQPPVVFHSRSASRIWRASTWRYNLHCSTSERGDTAIRRSMPSRGTNVPDTLPVS